MHKAKRWLFLIHRWVGIVMCLFFAMWFISGVVMMYMGYPKLTPTERLQHLPGLRAEAVLVTPQQALAAAGVTGVMQDLRLAAASGGQPVYLVTPARPAHAHGERRKPPGTGVVLVNATDGKVLRTADTARILASAQAYAGAGVGLLDEGRVQEDAFTHSKALDAHRPLHRVQLADADHTLLYISGSTGEVLRDATRSERIWNYAGAWIHWLYPFRGNVFDPYWTDIVIWLSIIGCALVLTGSVVGVMRWRFTRTYASGARTPYQGFMMRWHHITGLVFALITLTWIFSGLMSMNPWKVFDSGAPRLQTEAMHGGKLVLDAQAADVPSLLAALQGRDVRELQWLWTAGQAHVLARGPAGAPALLNAGTTKMVVLDQGALETSAQKLLPSAKVARTETLRSYDTYYYSREAHTMLGGIDKPLPVLRVVFDDPHATWVHIDPQTGAVLSRLDSTGRTKRWLFAMLHSWDWLPLLNNRPLWDVLLVVLSVGGAALSLTGVVIGWRRLVRKVGAAGWPSRFAPPRA